MIVLAAIVGGLVLCFLLAHLGKLGWILALLVGVGYGLSHPLVGILAVALVALVGIVTWRAKLL